MNTKIIDYKTIRAFESERSRFDDMVLESICRGWQPYGDPYTVTVAAQTTFCQAMVRYEEAEKAGAETEKPSAKPDKPPEPKKEKDK